jgi:tRNA G18 (ribose-2'-O)-methylase SpoU
MNRETNRGYFGVAVYRPKQESNVGSLWRSASAYGAAFVATVSERYERRQASDTTDTRRHVPLHHYTSINDLIEHLPEGCPLVGVELDPRATLLSDYTHRERALYLLGSEDHGLPTDVLDRCHDLIQVPTVTPWSINVACAGAIVLSHRHMSRLPRKQGRGDLVPIDIPKS